MATFAFRSGRSLKGTDPQAIGEVLDRIYREKGVLRPEDVLEEAKDVESPLHAAFEWNDSVAAQQHRLNQARRLIVSVRIIDSPVQTAVPAFVSVRSPEHGRGYVPTAEAMSDDQLRARVLMEVRQFVEGMQRRYAHFQEVADVIGRLKQSVA